MTPLELAIEAAKIATDKKAHNTVIQDLNGMSDICNYQVVCSAMNSKQSKAISGAIAEEVKTRYGTRPIVIEGEDTGHWVVLDFGGVIIHVFDNLYRNYYAIEELWPQAKRIDF